jgi:hypothetical protein
MSDTINRCASFPVVGVVDSTWPEFGKALNANLRESTRAANLASSMYFAQDKPAQKIGDKIKLPKVKFDGKPIYAAIRGIAPELPSKTASNVMQRVMKTYLKKRWMVMGVFGQSLPTFRFPFPFIVSPQNYALSKNAKGENCVTIAFGSRLADESRGRYTLRLRGGPEMRRQEKMLESAVKTGDLSIIRRRDGTVMVNISLTVKKQEMGMLSGEMKVLTGGGSFFRFARECDLKPLHADHVAGWQKEHDIRRQRLADDMKFEKRWPKQVRKGMLDKLAAICEKHNNRVNTFIEQATAMAVGYAMRRRLKKLILDSRDRTYMTHFPWFNLSARMSQKCEASGIEFVEIDSDETTASAKPKRDAGPGDVLPMAVPESDSSNGSTAPGAVFFDEDGRLNPL